MADTVEYTCPNCSAKMEFDALTQMMKCPYCDTVLDAKGMDKKEEDCRKTGEAQFASMENNGGQTWTDEEKNRLHVYTCTSCGGEILADETTGASFCPYCSNPVIMKDVFSGILKPDYVIPFQVTKQQAKDALKAHYRHKPFLPKVFAAENHLDEIRGIYVPFWLFDAKVYNDSLFEGTKVRTWSDRDYIYTETSHYHIVRSGELRFARVPVDGSQKMPDELMESIEPFDFSKAVDFQTAYLSGFLADKYDVDESRSVERAKQRMKDSIDRSILDTVSGYGTVNLVKNHSQVSDNRVKYALYPVWLLNTTWKGKKYLFAMNGQTGKFVGDLPVDVKKMLLSATGIAAGASAAAFGILYALSMGGIL